MRLLPKNRDHGWAPYTWLVYYCFFLLNPILNPTGWKEWLATGLGTVAFLALYFSFFWIKCPWNLLNIAGMLLLGVGFSPFNAGACTFFVFAAAFIPFAVEKESTAFKLLATVLAVARAARTGEDAENVAVAASSASRPGGALAAILECFRTGRRTLLSQLVRPRIDRILFAATKADHLHHLNHDRLEAILRRMVERAAARATLAGATIDVIALAAVRATREAQVRRAGELLPRAHDDPKDWRCRMCAHAARCWERQP